MSFILPMSGMVTGSYTEERGTVSLYVCVHVCVHESMCARGGGSNCTFGLLAPGAPRGPGWPPAPRILSADQARWRGLGLLVGRTARALLSS